MRRRRVGWVPTALALAFLGIPAPVAAASAEPAAAPADSVVGEGQHCAIGLAAERAGGAPSTAAPTVHCFDSLAASIDFATGGRVELSDDATRVDRRQLAAAGAISTESSVTGRPLLGIEYDGGSYSGGTLALYGASGSGCVQGTTYRFPDLRDQGFNDRVSSSEAFSRCFATHYEHSKLTGDHRACYSSCSSFGAMDNETTSIRFW